MLIMVSTQLGSDKYQFLSYWFDSTRFEPASSESPDLTKRETGIGQNLEQLPDVGDHWFES